MLVAALTDMIAVKDDLAKFIEKDNLDPTFEINHFEKQALGIINRIGKGVKNALVANVDGVIREAPCLSSFGPEHGNDYLAGRGIMMRFLGSNEEKKLLGIDLDDTVLETVNAIWETRDKANNQFQPEYTSVVNDKLYVEKFRKLWGMADNVHKWNLDKMKEKNKDGVSQAVGLDMIGAALKTLN